ncbi:MAG: glycerol-3-phosphate dehydrogenase [Woeseiaceae bacterium]|jgi:glycerol-3-phosphate dehydrogenase
MPAPDSQYDVVIVGGGINGAGIARDAALRGLRVLLLEKNDFGSGTSSWSSRLIHGGLRYLEYGEIPLVFESLHERRRLRHVASHLVDRLRLNLPVYKNARRGKLLIRLGMIAYDILSLGKKIPGHRMLTRDEVLREEPGLNQNGLVGAAQYYDAQVTFAERLVLENIIGAADAGAEVRNYSPVIGINVSNGIAQGLQYIDSMSGEEIEVSTRIIVNAAGPWVDRVLATVNREMPVQMGGTKGSHIVVGDFPGAPDSAFYVEAQQDGRPFFIIPWNKQYLIGTTDIRYKGDPGEVSASADEVQYLLAETNRVFPQADLELHDIHFAYAGVRPLPKREKGPESAITRKHIIRKHKKQARGLISIIGGKLTTYRNLSEQVVDKLVRRVEKTTTSCQTRTLPLPGAGDLNDVHARLCEFEFLTGDCIARLLGIYGRRALDIAMLARDREDLAQSIAEDGSILAAEVVFAMRHEYARSLVDIIHRRLMTGLSADQGASIAEKVAEIAAKEARWDAAEKQTQLAALRAYNQRLQPQSG